MSTPRSRARRATGACGCGAFDRGRGVERGIGAKRHAIAEIARFLGSAGQHKVAKARQARQCFGFSTKRQGKALHFGIAARHKRGTGGFAHSGANDHARRNGDHVFQRAAQFGPGHIGVAI